MWELETGPRIPHIRAIKLHPKLDWTVCKTLEMYCSGLEADKFRIKVPTDWTSGKGAVSAPQMTFSSESSHMEGASHLLGAS